MRPANSNILILSPLRFSNSLFKGSTRSISLVIVLFFLGIIFSALKAQQSPQLSQYLQNPYVINPAITGVESYLDMAAAYRNQWTGFDGAPSTATFTANTPLYLLRAKMQRREGQTHQGIGVYLYNDDTGPIKRGGYYGSYAYHLKLSKEWFLSMGAFVGANQFRYDSNEAILLQSPVDPLVQSFSSFDFDMSLGLYLYSKYFFVGFSANQIFNNEIPFDVDNGVLTTNGSFKRNFNLLLGSRIELSQEWEMVPSILTKAIAPAPLQFDLGLKLVYDSKFWFGLAYRNQEAITGIAGLRFGKRFLFSYSYDYITTDFSGNQSGTHEFILGYRITFANQNCACPSYSL